MDFDEYPLYPLFGLFFAGSGIAQFAWPIWLLPRLAPPARPSAGAATPGRRPLG